MDIETFLTVLYVQVDDWYKQSVAGDIHKQAGAVARLSDSEVLTIAIAGCWRVGVPWQSERGVVRWMQMHGRGMFPQMIGRSAFNARVRWLWGAFIRLQQVVAEVLGQAQAPYESVDCVPLPTMSNGQRLRDSGHWLWESQRGKGGTSGGFYVGDKVLASVTDTGLVTGWLVGNADLNDRWLLEALLSARAGQPQLVGPAPASHASRAERPRPPVGHMGAFPAVGVAQARPYLADQGFNSRRWRQHWQVNYAATVISVPPARDPERAAWSRADRRWLATHRQIIDTTFAALTTVFGWQHLGAHSRWGQYTRIAATFAAYHIGLWLNHALGRPLHALATLLV